MLDQTFSNRENINAAILLVVVIAIYGRIGCPFHVTHWSTITITCSENDKISLIVHTGNMNEATIAQKGNYPPGVVIFRPWTTIDYFTVLDFLPAVLSNRNHHWRSPPESSSNSQTCRHVLQLKVIQEDLFTMLFLMYRVKKNLSSFYVNIDIRSVPVNVNIIFNKNCWWKINLIGTNIF